MESVHCGMTGALILQDMGGDAGLREFHRRRDAAEAEVHRKLELEFDQGPPLAFCDPRRFGRLRCATATARRAAAERARGRWLRRRRSRPSPPFLAAAGAGEGHPPRSADGVARWCGNWVVDEVLLPRRNPHRGAVRRRWPRRWLCAPRLARRRWRDGGPGERRLRKVGGRLALKGWRNQRRRAPSGLADWRDQVATPSAAARAPGRCRGAKARGRGGRTRRCSAAVKRAAAGRRRRSGRIARAWPPSCGTHRRWRTGASGRACCVCANQDCAGAEIARCETMCG